MATPGPQPEVELAELASSGLFEQVWYLASNPDVQAAGMDPLLHWYQFGWREARNPNPYFDTGWYIAQNPDVAAADINPLLHYLRHGDREGRRPIAHFDPAWYRRAYRLRSTDIGLDHFLRYRSTGGFAPIPELYAVPFLDEDTVGGRNADPFARALEKAKLHNRDPCPDPTIVAGSGLLDQNYYLINGTDVREAELDPDYHFCRFGWKEGRKPNIYFDTIWYLRTNPDVARMDINPLVHYILRGEHVGRRPAVYFDPVWYRKTYAINQQTLALAHFLAYRRSQGYSPNPMFDVDWYLRHLGSKIGPSRDPFAHYLETGTVEDIDPSPHFRAAEYRRSHLGRPSRKFRYLMDPERYNPLVHYLRSRYQ